MIRTLHVLSPPLLRIHTLDKPTIYVALTSELIMQMNGKNALMPFIQSIPLLSSDPESV